MTYPSACCKSGSYNQEAVLSMPWHIVDEHSSCPASRPYGVVKDSDGEVEGCHATEESAEKQLAALYAAEDDGRSRMDAPREDLIRGLTPIRAADDGNTMIGYPVVFEQWAEINSWEGNFLERVLPSAPLRTLKSRGDKIKVQYNHGMHPVIGTSGLGKPKVMKPDERGVYTETPLAQTSYNRDIIKPLLADGTLDGMSFRFSVIDDRWNHPKKKTSHNPNKLPERDIVEFKWHEFGPVDWPAYEASQAGIRSQAALALWMQTPAEQRAELMRQFQISTPEPPRIIVPGFSVSCDSPQRHSPQVDDDGPPDGHPSEMRDEPDGPPVEDEGDSTVEEAPAPATAGHPSHPERPLTRQRMETDLEYIETLADIHLNERRVSRYDHLH